MRKFLIEQEYIDDVPKTIWLRRFPGLSLIGEMDAVRAVARAMICQLAAFHSPADVQIIVVSSAPSQWDWVKWLPHVQHGLARDGCGERRLVFSSPAKLEAFLDEAEPTARGVVAAAVGPARRRWRRRAAAAGDHRRSLRHRRGLGRADRQQRL